MRVAPRHPLSCHNKPRTAARCSALGKKFSVSTIGCDDASAGRMVVHPGGKRTAQVGGLWPRSAAHPSTVNAPQPRTTGHNVGRGYVAALVQLKGPAPE